MVGCCYRVLLAVQWLLGVDRWSIVLLVVDWLVVIEGRLMVWSMVVWCRLLVNGIVCCWLVEGH